MNIHQHKEWVSLGELKMPEIRITHPMDKHLPEKDKRLLLNAEVRFYNVSEDVEILGVVVQFKLKESEQVKEKT